MAIPLPPAPATEPAVKYHGVYLDEKTRAPRWKVILERGAFVKHIAIPNSDKYMSRERAEELARSIKWEDA